MSDILEEFSTYNESAKEVFNRLVEEGCEEYSESLAVIWDLYVFLNFLTEKTSYFFNKPLSLSASILFNKMTLNNLAIANCLMGGLNMPVTNLLRDLFEVLINAKVLTENDFEFRSKLFLDYKHIHIWQLKLEHESNIEKLKRDPRLRLKLDRETDHFSKLFNSDKLNLIETNYNRVKDNYHPQRPYKWYWKLYENEFGKKYQGPNIRELADRFGLIEEYTEHYSLNSISVHISPLVKNQMSFKGRMRIFPDYNHHIPSFILSAVKLSRDIVKTLLQTVEVKKPRDIEHFFIFLRNRITDEGIAVWED